MFTVIYRWKVKSGCEEDFRAAWRRATEAIYRKYNSRGSRLHKSDDGRWIAYAQWRSREDWLAMQNSSVAADEEAFAVMRDSIEGATEVTCLTVTDDLFK